MKLLTELSGDYSETILDNLANKEMVIKNAKEDLDAYYSGNTQYYEDEQNLLLNQLEQLNDSDKEDYEKYYVCSHQKFEVDGYVAPYGDSPLDDERVGENVYLNMINQAYDYLYITTPYLILDDNLQTALINAAKRGVDVRIITPGIPDKKIVFRVTRSYYQTLIKHGSRIYEYTPGFIHAKNFLVDDKCATVGTINLDYRSLYLHFENGIYLYNNKILKDIKEDFLATVEKSHEITLDEVVTGKFMGWFEAILRVIAPLL